VDYVYGDDAWYEGCAGLTPLQLACQSGSFDCIRPLLRGGADSTFKNKHGNDAVDVLLQAGSDSNDALECLRLLLSVPYNVPVDQANAQGRTRLHNIQETTPVTVAELLVEANTPLDLQDQDGHSPLSLAINKGNESVAKYLVKQGANVNRCNPKFGSILHMAVSKGNLDMVKFLLGSGADPERVDPKYGESLLYTALGIEDSAILTAMVRYLVDEAKVPIDKHGGVQFGYPIIRATNLSGVDHLAAIQIIHFLIRRKVRLDVADGQGRRAMHIAAACQWTDAVRAISQAGAEWNVKDSLGRKPIHFAASAFYHISPLPHFLGLIKEGDRGIDDVDDDGWYVKA
jgi:ankyrin repeat protein